MELEFVGTPCDGAGLFSSQILIPSPIEQLYAIEKWPRTFEKGTFNIRVDTTKWPNVPGLDFSTKGIKCLDRSRVFKPELYLDYFFIKNNTITPRRKGEFAGDLQFWRASLEFEGKAIRINCFIFRRVKSFYEDIIELISDCHIRNTHAVCNEDICKLIVYDKLRHS